MRTKFSLNGEVIIIIACYLPARRRLMRAKIMGFMLISMAVAPELILVIRMIITPDLESNKSICLPVPFPTCRERGRIRAMAQVI